MPGFILVLGQRGDSAGLTYERGLRLVKYENETKMSLERNIRFCMSMKMEKSQLLCQFQHQK